MLGPGYIGDLLAKQINSAGKAARTGYRSVPMPKAPAARTGYHGVTIPSTRTAGASTGYRTGYAGNTGPRRVTPIKGASQGYRTGNAGTSGPRSVVPPPPKAPGLFANHGKKIAAGLAVGAMGGAVMSRTGKAVDPQTGLPKGIYNY